MKIRLISLIAGLLFLSQVFQIDAQMSDALLNLARLEVELRGLNAFLENQQEEEQRRKQEEEEKRKQEEEEIRKQEEEEIRKREEEERRKQEEEKRKQEEEELKRKQKEEEKRKRKEEEKQKQKEEKRKQKEEEKRKQKESEEGNKKEEYYKKYANLFNRFPEKYKDVVFHYYYYEKYPCKKYWNADNKLVSSKLSSEDQLQQDVDHPFPLFARKAILKSKGGSSGKIEYDYTFMKLPTLKGKRTEYHFDYESSQSIDLKKIKYIDLTIKDYKDLLEEDADTVKKDVLKKIKQNESNNKGYKKTLAKNYKIHLMPKLDEVAEVTSLLVDALVADVEFGQVVNQFKVKYNLDSIVHPDGQAFPVIVIYPASRKKNAQKALDKIVELFKDRQGLDIAPRYNAKVTSLIYIAQGDGDDKKYKSLQHYFEQPKMVYYKRDFTGEDKNYYLTYQGKNII